MHWSHIAIREPGPGETSGLWRRIELRAGDGDGESDGVWPAVERRLAAARARPCLRPGLVLKPSPGPGDGAYLLGDPVRGRYYRLGEREAQLLSLLDGQRDAKTLARHAAGCIGGLSPAAVETFLGDLWAAGLLDDGPTSLWQRLAARSPRGPLVVWSLPGAGPRLAALYRRVRLLFQPAAGAALLLLGLTAAAAAAVRLAPGPAGEATLPVDLAALAAAWPASLLLLPAVYLALVPVVLTHELAHALACFHFGGRATRLGLMVRRGLPAAFADITDVYSLAPRARIAVYLAGPLSTLAWAAGAAALWAATPSGGAAHLAAGALAAAALLLALGALNPVGGYDGSEALAEWLAVPDLHRRAAAYWRGRLRGRIPDPARVPDRRLLHRYGLAAIAFQAAAALAMLAGLAALIAWAWAR